MPQGPDKWATTVFRLRSLPHYVETKGNAANLLQGRLGDIALTSIHVYSLATTVYPSGSQPSKVATLMFSEIPSILTDSQEQDEWALPPKEACDRTDGDLILDTHFLGMTPLNDVKADKHLSDCIAISGLASHPFGSWQPKGGDKTFMWIRDSLPRDSPGTRAVLYGYNTRLDDSRSFQSISDLAHSLISQLEACGWGSRRSTKPVAFLAHSLGGLVLRDALVQLATSSSESYKALLSIVHGAILFGVPVLGMEQEHFRSIAQGKPNEPLIEDIARNSNYLRRVNTQYSETAIDKHLECFWAYETSLSPTISTVDGRIDRNGPPAILVSRESATSGLIQTNRSLTFPINSDHSGMVKFTRDSAEYHLVFSKLARVLASFGISSQPVPGGCGLGERQPSVDSGLASKMVFDTGATDSQPMRSLRGELDAFDRILAVAGDTKRHGEFSTTTLAAVYSVIREIQTRQEGSGRLMYMKRLEPFLVSMKQYGEVTADTQLFLDLSSAMAHVWGPMKHILQVTCHVPAALNAILDAYQEIGEEIPVVRDHRRLFTSHPHLTDVLVMVYKDLLWFHREIIQTLDQQPWDQLFEASWRDVKVTLSYIKQNLAQSKRLLESRATLPQFEEIQHHRLGHMRHLETNKVKDDADRRVVVRAWLSAYDCETVQNHHRKKRSVCTDPGRWLINDKRFQAWFGSEYCSVPLLGMTGKPGAGKTVLASVVIDEARRLADTTVVFFYCKHADNARNTFASVAKSVLAQFLLQSPHLLPYFHEKASVNSDVSLVGKDMIQTALLGCKRTFIIIDGLDECGRDDRVEIVGFFRAAVEDLPNTEVDGAARCLFVSQDDGITTSSFRGIPTISIGDRNRDDLSQYAQLWHERIEHKFGDLRGQNLDVANIIVARAEGMFIFAELFANYLEDQFSRADLLAELDPVKLPVKLDQVYERILLRVLDRRGDHTVEPLRQVLTWVVCARRPLRWREIQAAVSIDLDTQDVDYDKEISECPKGLFASLVELQVDETVNLVHRTASEYLIRTKFVEPEEGDYSLAMLSIAYLSFPQFDKQRSEEDIESDTVRGIHAFYDYASACWALHLQHCVGDLKTGVRLSKLQETLETFIEVHWSQTHKTLPDLKRIRKALSPLQTSDQFEDIVQAVGWAKKQCGPQGRGPTADDALDLWRVTEEVRSGLERVHSDDHNSQALDRFYGQRLYKCARVNCYSYHNGFLTPQQRLDHVSRHERPFLCFVTGCHMEVFGCVSKDELKKHLYEYHGIGVLGGPDDDVEFPDPPREKKPGRRKAAATYACHLCPKTFTASHNLKGHLRVHEGTKPFECSVCGECFTRKPDCDRHVSSSHGGEKKFTCVGPLQDGGTWGCKTSFARADNLAGHIRSKAGQKCIRPLVLEKLRADGGGQGAGDGDMFAGQVGENADALLAAGKSLPSFADFLKLCKIDPSVIGSKTGTTSREPPLQG